MGECIRIVYYRDMPPLGSIYFIINLLPFVLFTPLNRADDFN